MFLCIFFKVQDILEDFRIYNSQIKKTVSLDIYDSKLFTNGCVSPKCLETSVEC